MNSMTEKQMRDTTVPWIKTAPELSEYIEGLIEQDHDYGTCVYAMSMAAVAAFQYVAGAVGASGFQASCADMDVLRRTRSIPGPFMLIDAENALYPQYDLHQKLADFLKEIQPWLKDMAKEKLKESQGRAHEAVESHWRKLAE